MKKTLMILSFVVLFVSGCATTRSEFRVNWNPFEDDLEVQFVAIQVSND